jgi:hypothetical protein
VLAHSTEEIANMQPSRGLYARKNSQISLLMSKNRRKKLKKRKKLYEFGVKVTIYEKKVKDFGVIWYRNCNNRENFTGRCLGEKIRLISELQKGCLV